MSKSKENYHQLTKKITDLFLAKNIWFETFVHEPVRTSEEASRVRKGYSIDQDAKALIIRAKELNGNKYFCMLVMCGKHRFDNAKVKNILNTKDIRFATTEEVSSITGGVLPGGVPPLGNLFGIKVVADPELLNNEKIIFNAGDRRFSLAMKSDDYINFVNPKIESIV